MKTIIRHWRRIVLWGGVSLIYLIPFFSQPIFSAVFAKYDGIDGESEDPGHTKWVEILSANQKVTVPITGGGAGAPRTAGTPEVSDLTITAAASIASPQLFFQAVSGAMIPEITIEVTRDIAAVGPVTFYKLTMKDVLISGYSAQMGNFPKVTYEELSLNYGKITYEYTQFDDKTGTPVDSSSAGWDVDNETPF